MENDEISVVELAGKQERGDDFVLLDVREASEREICIISGDVHIPMREVRNRFFELPRDKEIVVYCHTGNRSFWITTFLRTQGFTAKNLTGGIDAWAEEIEPSLARY